MTTATSTTMTAYDELLDRAREAQLLGSTTALLHWDQEVLMPKGGVDYRSRQLAFLARVHHQHATDERIGELLAAAAEEVGQDGPAAANVRELKHAYERRTKLPAELVEEEARLASVGQHHWAAARKASDFGLFEPYLGEIVGLLRRKADCFGWAEGGEPWDALAEDYETGCTAAGVEEVFTPLRERLQTLLDAIMGSSTRPSNAFNEVALPIKKQQAFVRAVAEAIGFDFHRGRLDTSTHPFCSGTHCNDVRLTTRFHENNVNDALGSTMHEAGHGIYEQGLLYDHVGTPMGDAVSLGIHESQSRMWENQVGRSRAFWEWCHPLLKEHFGDAVNSLSIDDVYGGANIVKPDFIRVEADESTYNMHIMIRFEIERALMSGAMQVADIPDAWNQKYRDYLGIEVTDIAKGCLQDIHWSMCAIGYFPTYTLGNLYCAQFFESATAAMPDLHDQFRAGSFGDLKTWLNENIHRHGQLYRAADLCEHVTGKPLSADPLMRHLEGKLRPLYGI